MLKLYTVIFILLSYHFSTCVYCSDKRKNYTLSRKKEKINVMFGALGSILDQNFYMRMQNVLSLEKC